MLNVVCCSVLQLNQKTIESLLPACAHHDKVCCDIKVFDDGVLASES